MSKQQNKPFTLPNEPIVPTVQAPQPQQISLEDAMKIAEHHQVNGRLQDAEIVVRDILQAAPQYAPAIHLLGVIAHMAGRGDMAIELIEQAISINNKIPLFHANLAEMYRLQDRFEESVEAGLKAIALDPKFLFAQSNLGIAYYDLKDYDKAKDHHKIALEINPNFAPSLNNMGSILRAETDYAGAADYFDKAIAADPNFLDPQNNMGEVLTRLERPEDAVPLLEKVLQIKPDHDSAYCNLGMAHLALGDEEKTINCYVRALQIDPESVAAHAGLIMSALEFHKLEEGERAAHKLLEIAPDEPDSPSMLGSILLAQGKTDDAEVYFKQAIAMDDDYVPAKNGLGHVLMEKGDLKGAEALFQECIEKEKDEDSLSICSLVQVKKMKPDDPEIDILKQHAKRLEGKLVDSKAISLNFALGKMYDDIGEYDKGFPYYIEGCGLKRKSFDYNAADKEHNIDVLKQTFSKDFIEGHRGNGDESKTPIFILGMPRSGTTLTEQIIASHPEVYGAGELRDVMELTETLQPDRLDLDFGVRVKDITNAQIADFGTRYIEGLKARAPESPYITDKMPGNFHYLGLIHLMLPNAKIIHVNRNPLDNCISCFTRLFAHGQANTYDLEELGHYYKCYKDLMQHWQNVLPEGSFYDLQYERLVDNTEEEAKKLIDYCGLDWNDSCLEFYKNKRKIRTASVTQVRKPIYKSSKQRWKNYEQFLDPLIKGLGEAYKAEKS